MRRLICKLVNVFIAALPYPMFYVSGLGDSDLERFFFFANTVRPLIARLDGSHESKVNDSVNLEKKLINITENALVDGYASRMARVFMNTDSSLVIQ